MTRHQQLPGKIKTCLSHFLFLYFINGHLFAFVEEALGDMVTLLSNVGQVVLDKKLQHLLKTNSEHCCCQAMKRKD